MDGAKQKKSSGSLGQQARRGVLWYVLKTLGHQGSRFITSIVLARILFPEDFGIMGMALIVTRFAQRLGNFGFSQVLVQLKEVKEEHVRTTFTLNLFFSALITLSILAGAPFLAQLITRIDDAALLPKVIAVLRVISFTFIIHSFYTVPNSLLKRDMRFKEESMIAMLAGVVHFMIPIPLALLGFGVWSIVWGTLLGEITYVLGFYVYTKWVPRFGIHRAVFKDVFAFGAWMNAYSYVNYFINNIDYFMISKFLGAAQLGFYERAFNLMNAPRKRLADMINAVLFSTYSRIQDQDERLLHAFNRVMRSVALMSFPIMTWLYFAAPSLIVVLYGQKWSATIVPTQIMCISGLFQSMAMIFNPALLAKGLVRERTFAYFYMLIILAIGVFLGAQKNISYVAIAVSVASSSILYFNGLAFKKHTSWRWIEFWRNIKHPVILTVVMIMVILGIKQLVLLRFANTSFIMLTAVTGAAFLGYVGGGYLFRFREVQEIVEDTLGEVIAKIKKIRTSKTRSEANA